MITTSEFKAGLIIRWKGNLYQLLSYQHVKMQQRAPIVRTKMMKIIGGSVSEQSFRSGDKFEDVYLEKKELQYLYNDGQFFHFMDTADYHDITVGPTLVGDKTKFLKDNDMVTGLWCDDELVAIELAALVTLKVTETEPGLRGDTAKGGTKPAKLETGVMVKVPLFVNLDDMIRVDSRTGQYVERA
jgi:elongation factor P